LYTFLVNELVTLTSKSHNGCTNTKKLQNIFHFRTLEEPKNKNIPLMQSQVQVQLQLQLQLMHDRPKLFRFRVAQFVGQVTHVWGEVMGFGMLRHFVKSVTSNKIKYYGH